MKEKDVHRYMLIDVTTVEETKILLISDIRRIVLHGYLQKYHGRVVIGPPAGGSGFSKLSKEQLQYLYWNHTGNPPLEDYAALLQACLELVWKLPMDETSQEALTAKVRSLCPEALDGAAVIPIKDRGAAAAVTQGEAPSRPKAKSTTGAVWEIADKLYSELGGLPDRKKVLAFCESAGINAATASTQYSKWKAAKLVALASS